MRRRFPSDSYEVSKIRRLKRIRRRSHPELIHVYEHGELSLRQFDAISKRSIREQKRFVTGLEQETVGAQTAAKVIERFLNDLQAGTPIRLPELATEIRNACSKTGTVVNHH
jgi:hypothetical protein